jgi:hypothetical protein
MYACGGRRHGGLSTPKFFTMIYLFVVVVLVSKSKVEKCPCSVLARIACPCLPGAGAGRGSCVPWEPGVDTAVEFFVRPSVWKTSKTFETFS